MQIDNQATIAPILGSLDEAFPIFARTAEPAVLDFGEGDFGRISTFVRRNFGASIQSHILCRDRKIPTVKLPPDDRDVMAALAGNRNILFPIHICGAMPRGSRAYTEDALYAITIYYGSTSWNFADYWNSVHYLDGANRIHRSLSELWMQPEILENKFVYEAFIEMLRRRTFVDNHQQRLRLVSHDQNEESLRKVTQKICLDFKWNLYPANPVVRKRGDAPTFQKRPTMNLFGRTRAQSQLVSGRGLLQFDPPPGFASARDGLWVTDLAIESPGQERYASNRATWWKLPKKQDAARLFVPDTSCRVNNEYRISVQISAQQQGLIIRTPELRSLFSVLLLPTEQPQWHQESTHADALLPKGLYIRTSDKGMYARGVLGLFESLQKASYVFEHRYWRSVIECQSSPRASAQVRTKVKTELESAMSPDSGVPEIESIVDQVLDASQRIPRFARAITFGELFNRYESYLASLNEDDRIMEATESGHESFDKGDEKAVRKAARRNLRRMLSELTARKLFLQGADLTCNHCLVSLWYHIDDLRSTAICRGCRRDISLPAETPWSYSLNELVASAVRDHGVVPVIRTIYQLFAGSRECFCYLAGLEVRSYNTEPETQFCEVDLVWISDGELGVAEVKGGAPKFPIKRNLADLIKVMRPDRFLLASTSASDGEITAACSKAEERLERRVKVQGWGADKFDRSDHMGWNTFVHSF